MLNKEIDKITTTLKTHFFMYLHNVKNNLKIMKMFLMVPSFLELVIISYLNELVLEEN